MTDQAACRSRTAARGFWGWGSVLLLAAAAATYALVATGLDWQVFLFSRRHPLLFCCFVPSVILGGIVPVLVPGALYLYGRLRRRAQHLRTAIMLAQTAVAGFVVASLLKVVSGRTPPGPLRGYSPADTSGAFRFGFLNGGIVDGWPSGHTLVAVAMAVVVARLPGAPRPVRALALAYALYVGLGVAVSIHWLSDAVAGALLGVGVGLAASERSPDPLPR